MNTELIDIEKVIENINIEDINTETNFWLVRTKKGFFYDEYIKESFIALGWNIVDSQKILDVNNDEDKIKLLKEELEKRYGSKQGTQIYNKCTRFINEFKQGDIVMIPSSCNEFITFAVVGEYYEDSNLDYYKELEVIKRIDDQVDYGTEIKCPYKKRRYIKKIKTISGKRLNPNLYKVLSSYHGVSKINDYSNFVLSSMYSNYYWNGKLNMVFNVEQSNDINAKQLAAFIYNTTDLIANITGNEDVSAKTNLNSPGEVIISALLEAGNNLIEFADGNKIYILLIWLSIVGGSIGPLKFNSVLEFILKFREQQSKLKNDKLDRDIKEFERYKLEENYKKIKEASNVLKINTNDTSNIINIQKYKDAKKED